MSNGTTLYTDGTGDFTNGSQNVTGHSTLWTNMVNGDTILAPDGNWYEFTITDDTHIVLDRNYGGSTVTIQPYTIFKNSTSRDSIRTSSKQLTAISATYGALISATGPSQTLKLNKSTTADSAGVTLRHFTDATDTFQIGAFGDDAYAIKWQLASVWTKAFGVDNVTGACSLLSQLLLGGIIRPAQITSDTPDYAPTGLDQAAIIMVSTDATRQLSGLTGGVDGRVIAILNTGVQQLTIPSEGLASAAGNRFKMSVDLPMLPNTGALFIYDGTSSRWRALANSGAGGGGTAGWSPILAVYVNGSRNVFEVIDWEGGGGSKPATGSFLGASGLVSTPAAAVDVTGAQGSAGATGPQGATSTNEFNFSVTTTDADPSSGNLRFNNATFGSVTTIYVNDHERGGTDVSTWIDTFDDSTNTSIKGSLTITDVLNPTVFAQFQITGSVINATTYRKLTVTPIVGSIPADTRRISMLFVRTGDAGTPTGAVLYNSAQSLTAPQQLQAQQNMALAPAAANLNTRLAKTATYTPVNADDGKTIALGGNAFFALTYGVASTYDANYFNIILNEDTNRAKNINVNGVNVARIYPGQSLIWFNSNNTFQYIRNNRWKLFANLTVYVDVTNGNDANDGLAAGAGGAFQTIQTAINIICSNFDLNGQTVTVQLADGTYAAGLNLTSSPIGGGSIVINGHSGAISNVFISSTTTNCFYFTVPTATSFAIQNLKMKTTAIADVIVLDAVVTVNVTNVEFNGAGSGGSAMRILVSGARINCGAITISASVFSVMYAMYGGIGNISSASITFTGTPTITYGFISQLLAIVELSSATWTGTFTGIRYLVSQGSILNTNGQATTWIPGTASGQTQTNGQYL